jgi:hypothetical protein
MKPYLHYRRRIQEAGDEAYISKLISKATGKPVTFESDRPATAVQLKTIDHWIAALTSLPGYPLPWRIFQRECKGIVLGQPHKTEDAQWRKGKIMFLATRDAGYSKRHMMKSLIHEVGHAFEEIDPALAHKLETAATIYGKPPFANNYAATSPFEDFAETFMLLAMEPEYLEQVAPSKYRDMRRRTNGYA